MLYKIFRILQLFQPVNSFVLNSAITESVHHTSVGLQKKKKSEKPLIEAIEVFPEITVSPHTLSSTIAFAYTGWFSFFSLHSARFYLFLYYFFKLQFSLADLDSANGKCEIRNGINQTPFPAHWQIFSMPHWQIFSRRIRNLTHLCRIFHTDSAVDPKRTGYLDACREY